MRHLAKAVVDALAFLELSGEETVNEDDVQRVIEMLAAELRECSHEEIAALRQAAATEHEAQAADGAPREVLEFYRDLIDNLGLDED